jgi:hypothetical protein
MNRKDRRANGERGPTVGPLREPLPSVCLCWIHGEITGSFNASLPRSRDYEAIRTGTLYGLKERRANSGGIPDARNMLTAAVLNDGFEWLWFVDADMGFPKDALQKLLAAADPVDRPIMGGLCFAQQAVAFDDETNAEEFGIIPTLYAWERRADDDVILGCKVLDLYPRNTVCKVDATGAAFLLIHRSVFERMLERYGPAWWTVMLMPHQPRNFGEDTSFCLRCEELGIPIHVHTGVRTSHKKEIYLTEKLFDAQRADEPTPELEKAG